MNVYASVASLGLSESYVKNSRFIGSVHHVDSFKDALLFIDKIKKSYNDASHYVYAIRLRNGSENGSDDGEPSGTGARPILSLLRTLDLFDIVVVVTRYYGGIHLGTGGLSRAYASCAKETIDDAKICLMKPFYETTFFLSYEQHPKIENILRANGYTIESTNYYRYVELTLLCKDVCQILELIQHQLHCSPRYEIKGIIMIKTAI